MNAIYPRCHKPVSEYRKPGLRPPEPFPMCGRREGHNGRCLSEWAYRRYLDKKWPVLADTVGCSK